MMYGFYPPVQPPAPRKQACSYCGDIHEESYSDSDKAHQGKAVAFMCRQCAADGRFTDLRYVESINLFGMLPILNEATHDRMKEGLRTVRDLVLVQQGKAWKIEYTRLETLINGGLVNALGTRLTKMGERALS